MWDLPGPGLEPMSPALAGGFLTTAPPGKSLGIHSDVLRSLCHFCDLLPWLPCAFAFKDAHLQSSFRRLLRLLSCFANRHRETEVQRVYDSRETLCPMTESWWSMRASASLPQIRIKLGDVTCTLESSPAGSG